MGTVAPLIPNDATVPDRRGGVDRSAHRDLLDVAARKFEEERIEEAQGAVVEQLDKLLQLRPGGAAEAEKGGGEEGPETRAES
jgi:hypothetical protein